MSITEPSTANACVIAGCNGPVLARHWCSRHYGRWRHHGDPEFQRAPRIPVVCAEEGCDRPAQSRGWCGPHYKKWLRWGTPSRQRPTIPAETRFWSKVNRDGPQPATFRHRGPCWQWMAGCIAQGYGSFHPARGHGILAHRYSYEIAKGPIPDGLQIDHLCRNRRCVNPDHLEAVAPGENTRRGLSVSTFNALKKSCPADHPYDATNTYVCPRGGRRCRTCARDRDRLRSRRKTTTQRRAA